MSPPLTPSGLALGGVYPDRPDRAQAVLALPRAAFTDAADRYLYDCLSAYYSARRSVPPTAALADQLKAEDPERRVSIAERYKVLSAAVVEQGQFEWACSNLLEVWREHEAASAVLEAAEIVTTGVPEIGRDGEATGKIRAGYEAARDALARRFALIDRYAGAQVAPQGDVSEELDEVLADYGSGHRRTATFPTGIPDIDSVTAGGPAPGELWFVAAYAGSGKTTFATSVLSYQAWLAGLNVLYMTGETLRSVVRRRFVVRHTRHPAFELPGGIDQIALKDGRLSQSEYEVFQAAAQDIADGSGARYGHLAIRQMSLQCSFSEVIEALNYWESRWPVHVLVVDSVDMVQPDEVFRADTTRDRLGRTIELFAQLAVAHDGGRGLTVVSPYQIKRDAYEEAVNNSGRYTLSALAETSMAERRASFVLSLLKMPERESQLQAQILKNRDGPTAEFPLDIDFRSSYIGPAAGAASFTAVDSLL